MWRKFFSIFFLFAFTIQLFNQGVYYATYFLNKAAFIRNCKNKAKPQLNCNGNCQLMKMIKAKKENDQGYPDRKLIAKADIHSSKSFFAKIESPFRNTSLIPISHPVYPLSDYAADIFRPPASLI